MPYLICLLFFVFIGYSFSSFGGEGHIGVLESINWQSIARNMLYYMGVFSDFFSFPNPLELLSFKPSYLIPNPFGFVAFVLACIFMFIGLRERYKQDMFFILFVLGSLCMLILWPALQGIRFVFCMLPFMVFWCAFGVMRVMQRCSLSFKIICISLMTLTLMFFALKIAHFAYSLHIKHKEVILEKYYPANNVQSQAIYTYIKEHTQSQDVIIFFKPRVLYLFTNRLSFATHTLDKLLEAQYLLDYRGLSVDESFMPYLIPIFKQGDYTFYKINYHTP